MPLILQRAQPVRAGDIDRLHFQAMALCVFNKRERLIKTHRLIVQHRSGERRQVMTFQIGAGISEQRETGGV